MALDFSHYGGPSEEWLAVERTLPASTFDTNADPIAIRAAVNTERENRAAAVMATLGVHVHTVDYPIPTRDGATIKARTYRSVKADGLKRLPVYIYFHGGGFIFGTLSSEDAACAQTAINTGVVVLNVNYRHTPEHTFPTAWHDSQDAFAWLHQNIDTVRGDASRVLVGGVSAGGQLAASLALEKHLGKSETLKGLPDIAGQIVIIPCVASPKNVRPRTRQAAEGPVLR